MDPLELMIEDCWLHLFEFLTAREKQVLCETCTTFQEMLEPQKTNWAFELILPHIMKHLDYPYYPGGRITYNEALGLRLQLLLKLRLVNKSWKMTFDQYFGSHVEQYGEGIYVRSVNDFRNVARLEKFLTVFKDHSGNPFVGRQVTIYASKAEIEEPEPEDANELLQNGEQGDAEIVNDEEEGDAEIVIAEVEEPEDEEEDYEEEEPEPEDANEANAQEEGNAGNVDDAEFDFVGLARAYVQGGRERSRAWNLQNRDLLMQILPKYGEEIHYLSVYNTSQILAGGYCPIFEALKFLQQVLCKTPNLQMLELNLHNAFHESIVENKPDLTDKAVRGYFEMNPLPKLPKLRVLKFHDTVAALQNLLLEANGADLESLITYTPEVSALALDRMRSLQTLELTHSKFESVEKLLRGLISPLEKLYVEYWNRERNTSTGGKFFMIDRFLLAIQHLPLKEIEIYPDSKILKESEPFPDGFPKHMTVTKLSVQEVSFISLNFLQFLPKLQTVFVGKSEIPYPTVYRQMK